MILRNKVEHELRVESEVEQEVKHDASPDEKMINPRPVLREKRDLTRTKTQLVEIVKGFPELCFVIQQKGFLH